MLRMLREWKKIKTWKNGYWTVVYDNTQQLYFIYFVTDNKEPINYDFSNSFLPTEKTIYNTKDQELIDWYNKIDNLNKEKKPPYLFNW